MKRLYRRIRTDWKQWRWSFLLIFALFLLMLVFLIRKHDRLTTNPRSRIITVERLLEAGTFEHPADQTPTTFEPTIDRIMVDGKYYSSKPPNYPLLMALQASVVRAVTGWNFYEHRTDYLRYLVILNQILPYILLLLIAFYWLRDYTSDRWTLNFMLLALSIGLLPYGYAVTINNHSVAAIFFFLAFYLLYRIRIKKDGRFLWYALIGALAGFAVTIELHAGVFLLWFLILLFLQNWKFALGALGIAVLMYLPSLIVYHEITGSWEPTYLQGGLYRVDGGYWTRPEGWDAVREPKFIYLLNTLFGHHGLFTLTPLLLLGPIALFRSWRKKKEFFPMAYTGILVGILIVIWFIVSRTHNYGGHSIGLRWYIVFMPLLMFAAWPLVLDLGKRLWGRLLCAFLLLLSIPWNLEAMVHEAYIQGSFEKIWVGLFGGGIIP